MVNPHRKALERLWRDRCTIFHRVEATNPDTNLTDFQEMPLFEDQPCKLSFEKLTSTDENNVATVAQGVKLFISPDIVIPAGCKIVVKRFNQLEREFSYSQSGEAAPFTDHQEITLTLWEGWA